MLIIIIPDQKASSLDFSAVSFCWRLPGMLQQYLPGIFQQLTPSIQHRTMQWN
jgi:hypothetical protein